MRERLVKYSLIAGLTLLLAAPAVAYSQRNAPQGPGAGPGAGFGPGPGIAPGPQGGMGPGGPGMGPGGQPGMAPRAQRGRMGADRARGPRERMRGGLAAQALAHADEIGLSAEQRDQILAAQRALQEDQINRRAASEIASLELRDLMGAETHDLAAIEAKLRELSEQRIAGQMAALRFEETVGGLLSAEQRETLEGLAPQRRRGAPDRPGRDDRPGPDGRGPRRDNR